jgi:thiopeptide-type bacteriocin biosynthesis protein
MSAIVFVGPTVAAMTVTRHFRARLLPPAEQGDILRALADRPSMIGLIDGRFELTPSVWHKEILVALAEGVRVYGAASMGALRAAELSPFGMMGVGQIYQSFRDGTLEDDDEVAVAHAAEEFHFRPLSEAMVNLRDIVARASQKGVLALPDAESILAAAKGLHFRERGYPQIYRVALCHGVKDETIKAFERFRLRLGPSLKERDGILMLQRMAADMRKTRLPRPLAVRVEPTIFLRRLEWEVEKERESKTMPEGRTEEVIRKKVLLGLLASAAARRRGMLIGDHQVRETEAWFRNAYGLGDEAAFQQWLKTTGLAPEQFALAMYRFTSINKVQETYRQQIEEEAKVYRLIYSCAGLAADANAAWLQMNVQLGRTPAVAANGRKVLQAMEKLVARWRAGGRPVSFHFVRKPPDVRIRLRLDHDPASLVSGTVRLLERLRAGKTVEAFFRSIYEPEVRQFGGKRASEALHDYFAADASGWLAWSRLAPERRRMSGEAWSAAIMSDLFWRTLGCGSEVWDVWENLRSLTESGSVGPSLPDEVAQATSLHSLAERTGAGERKVVAIYEAANEGLAATLRKIWSAGELSAGLRAVLPFVAMFHSNRYGHGDRVQYAIATVQAAAWNPKSGLRGNEA